MGKYNIVIINDTIKTDELPKKSFMVNNWSELKAELSKILKNGEGEKINKEDLELIKNAKENPSELKDGTIIKLSNIMKTNTDRICRVRPKPSIAKEGLSVLRGRGASMARGRGGAAMARGRGGAAMARGRGGASTGRGRGAVSRGKGINSSGLSKRNKPIRRLPALKKRINVWQESSSNIRSNQTIGNAKKQSRYYKW